MSIHNIRPNRRRTPEGQLSGYEKKCAKKLLDMGYIAQDIQFIVNQGRKTTINSRCISEVRNHDDIAADSEVDEYLLKQKSYDPKTGLNPYEKKDIRIIKAREAMLSAVQAFNNPILTFKSEQFCVLSQIAWTGIIQNWLSINKALTPHQKMCHIDTPLNLM